MSKLRVAVIGTGMIANSAHFPALNDLRMEGLIEVVGVADIREEVAMEAPFEEIVTEEENGIINEGVENDEQE